MATATLTLHPPLNVLLGDPLLACVIGVVEGEFGVRVGFTLEAFGERLVTAASNDDAMSVGSVRDGYIDGLHFADEWFREREKQFAASKEMGKKMLCGNACNIIRDRLIEIKNSMPAEAPATEATPDEARANSSALAELKGLAICLDTRTEHADGTVEIIREYPDGRKEPITQEQYDAGPPDAAVPASPASPADVPIEQPTAEAVAEQSVGPTGTTVVDPTPPAPPPEKHRPAFSEEASDRIRFATEEAQRAKLHRVSIEDDIAELNRAKKKAIEAEEEANAKLYAVINGAEMESRQRRLPLVDPDAPKGQPELDTAKDSAPFAAGEAAPTPPAVDDSWRGAPIKSLGLSDGVEAKLVAAHIENVGQLEDQWEDIVRGRRKIEGIAKGTIEKIANAKAAFLRETRDKEVFDQIASAKTSADADAALKELGFRRVKDESAEGERWFIVREPEDENDDSDRSDRSLNIAELWDFIIDTKGGGIGQKTPTAGPEDNPADDHEPTEEEWDEAERQRGESPSSETPDAIAARDPDSIESIAAELMKADDWFEAPEGIADGAIFEDGRTAYRNSERLDQCPYRHAAGANIDRRNLWMRGWLSGRRQARLNPNGIEDGHIIRAHEINTGRPGCFDERDRPDIFGSGMSAYDENAFLIECPYEVGSPEATAWLKGWMSRHHEEIASSEEAASR